MIGVYTGVMSVHQFPFTSSLSPVIVLSQVDKKTDLNIVLSAKSGAVFAELDAELVPDSSKILSQDAWLPLPPLPVVLSGSDVIELKVSFNNGAAAVAGELIVNLIDEARVAG